VKNLACVSEPRFVHFHKLNEQKQCIPIYGSYWSNEVKNELPSFAHWTVDSEVTRWL